MRNSLRTGLLVLMLGLLGSLVGADVLFLNEGEEEVGTLLEIASGQVRFQDTDGREQAWPTEKVAHVLISKLRQGDDIHAVASLTDPFLTDLLKKTPGQEEYPHSNWVTLFQKAVFHLNEDGSITLERRIIQKILREDGLGLGNVSLYYYHPRDNFELLFAHTYAPDGRIHHLTDNALSMESLFTSTPEYDFARKCKFAMNKVTVGSIIDLSFRQTTRRPEALFPYVMGFIFGEREPVLRQEVEIVCPQSRHVLIHRENWKVESPKTLTESVSRDDKQTVYRWEFRDPKGVIFEQAMSPLGRIFPRLLVIPMEAAFAGDSPEKADLTGAWNHLGQELFQAVSAAAPTPAALQEFLATLDQSKTPTPLMKAQALYDLILRRIRLIGLAVPNIGNLVPVQGDITLKKKYGNNFARLCLLHHGLKSLGLDTDVGIAQVWDANGILPGIPTLGQAQDLVLRLQDGGVTTYIWCGSDYLPFGRLPTSYQGASACFFPHGKAEFVTIPEGGPEQNRIERRVFIRLEENGDMLVDDLREYRGAFETSKRGLRSARKKELEQYAQGLVKRVHSNAELIDFSLSDLDVLTAPVFVSTTYRIPGAAIKAGNILAFENLWVDYRSNWASLASRTFPLDYSKTEEAANTVLIHLPDGYDWVPWQKQFGYESSRLRYASTLRQQERVLAFSDRFQVFAKHYPPEGGYQEFRSCLTEMGKVCKQWIVLEKNDPASPPPPPPPGSGPAPVLVPPSQSPDGSVPAPKERKPVTPLPDPQG